MLRDMYVLHQDVGTMEPCSEFWHVSEHIYVLGPRHTEIHAVCFGVLKSLLHGSDHTFFFFFKKDPLLASCIRNKINFSHHVIYA